MDMIQAKKKILSIKTDMIDINNFISNLADELGIEYPNYASQDNNINQNCNDLYDTLKGLDFLREISK